MTDITPDMLNSGGGDRKRATPGKPRTPSAGKPKEPKSSPKKPRSVPVANGKVKSKETISSDSDSDGEIDRLLARANEKLSGVPSTFIAKPTIASEKPHKENKDKHKKHKNDKERKHKDSKEKKSDEKERRRSSEKKHKEKHKKRDKSKERHKKEHKQEKKHKRDREEIEDPLKKLISSPLGELLKDLTPESSASEHTIGPAWSATGVTDLGSRPQTPIRPSSKTLDTIDRPASNLSNQSEGEKYRPITSTSSTAPHNPEHVNDNHSSTSEKLETATTKSLADSFDGLSPPGASTSSVSKPEPQSSSHKSSPFLQQYKDDTNNIASPPQHVSEIRKASPLPSTHTDYNEQPAEHEVPEDNAGQAAEVEQGGPPEETSLVNGHGNEDDDDDDFDLDDLPDPVAAI